jgi:hypothetical protein
MPTLSDLAAGGGSWFGGAVDKYLRWRQGPSALERLGTAFPQAGPVPGRSVAEVAPPRTSLSDEQGDALGSFLWEGGTKGGRYGTGLFDMSRLGEVPDVAQAGLARAAPPPKGYPEYLTKTLTPENLDRMDALARKGVDEMGARKWYNTEPLRDAFTQELGGQPGADAHRLYMNMVAATSPRSKVLDNIRNASYYFQQAQSGQPLPTAPPLPQPYGHIAQRLHMQNARAIMEQGGIPSDANPKPASFVENLVGNQEPYTFDTHMARNLGLRTAAGEPLDTAPRGHYGLLESTLQGRAKAMGLTPAQHQAAIWLAGGADTNLGSAPKPFMELFDDVVARTAAKRGEAPGDTLRSFLRGKAPLLSAGGLAGAGMGSYALPRDDAR